MVPAVEVLGNRESLEIEANGAEMFGHPVGESALRLTHVQHTASLAANAVDHISADACEWHPYVVRGLRSGDMDLVSEMLAGTTSASLTTPRPRQLTSTVVRG